MPRTKQTARKSTGSQAPRKTLANAAAKRPAQDAAARRSKHTAVKTTPFHEGGFRDGDNTYGSGSKETGQYARLLYCYP